ncbi:MAG: class I mannose-6-phosphate isomerase, partial [Bacteroidota bacterium]
MPMTTTAPNRESNVPTTTIRKTTQRPAPATHAPTHPGVYDIYPAFPIGEGRIGIGFESLARRVADAGCLTVDGYVGVAWEYFRERLDAALRDIGVEAAWTGVESAMRPEEEIDAIIAPFLGGDDPLWGTRFTGCLADLFDPDRLAALRPDPASQLNIIHGTGAALAGWDGHLLYIDIPKNEIQFRSRGGSVRNLGSRLPAPPKEIYKRFYFVDWPALNAHKARLLGRIDTIVDEQRAEEPSWMSGDNLRDALEAMSRNYFRVRPWFEPGPWGGHWIKEHIPGLPTDVPNYAWSFELIVPENGLAFQSDGRLLEVSSDLLMFARNRDVLGDCARRFGTEFPIRFDFLDTFSGGNLSVQCHPRPEYIREHFGESITQDETYYILDCAPDARVYLGFRDDIDPAAFRRELERSGREGTPVDIERYINSEPAHRGDLFLIPNGTVHCSGIGNLVLEISATPYIFTFKMYDWVRRDLEGNLRPLNIPRAWENLYFDRKGARIGGEFTSRPEVIAEGDDWRIVHLPTHADHFYDVHRLEFASAMAIATDGDCHVMNLVEGESILLETA